ncbi:MAG TPA: 5-oxoprolinase subunit PxpB [Flavisolibacter sp.]|nr:5-oxoprolinase subunit PxpB [Flavisolibacter sp.]
MDFLKSLTFNTVNAYHPYTIFPLGDTALTIDFGDQVDEVINRKVLRFFQELKEANFPFIKDIVPAYSTVTVFYDAIGIIQHRPGKVAFEFMAELMEGLAQEPVEEITDTGTLHRVPVCYDDAFGPDSAFIQEQKGITKQELIALHTETTYRVYMIGFLPGFAYMGPVAEKLAVPRKEVPRQQVPAGSVGIAGRQTGIYPLDSPGGWQLIGRTPVPMFNKEDNDPVRLRPGDSIQFYSITADEYAHYQGGAS